MSGYALDSDTVTYILRGKTNVRSCLNEALEQGNAVHIPPYVYYELVTNNVDHYKHISGLNIVNWNE